MRDYVTHTERTRAACLDPSRESNFRCSFLASQLGRREEGRLVTQWTLGPLARVVASLTREEYVQVRLLRRRPTGVVPREGEWHFQSDMSVKVASRTYLVEEPLPKSSAQFSLQKMRRRPVLEDNAEEGDQGFHAGENDNSYRFLF